MKIKKINYCNEIIDVTGVNRVTTNDKTINIKVGEIYYEDGILYALTTDNKIAKISNFGRLEVIE